MAKSLIPEQVEAFQRDGFLPRLSAFSKEQARRYRDALEAFEESQGAPLTALEVFYCYKLHLLFGWADEVVRHPGILAAVEDVIGPDILVYTSKFFIKEPRSKAITIWHQDATHFGFAAPESVAAWVAFCDTPVQSGCLEYVAGSRRQGQLQHRSGAHPDSLSGGAQTIVDPFDEKHLVAAPLDAGEFALHHCLCIHRSQCNSCAERRIGLSIHYVSPRIAHTGSKRVTAMLVRGEDRYGHYDLVAPPEKDMDQQARRVHKDAVGRYRANYAEQEVRHAEGLPATKFSDTKSPISVFP